MKRAKRGARLRSKSGSGTKVRRRVAGKRTLRRRKPRSGTGKLRGRKRRSLRSARPRRAPWYAQSYNEGYNAGFSKGFEDGHLIAYEQQP